MEGITASEAAILKAAETVCDDIERRFGAAAYTAEPREAGYYGRAAESYHAAAYALGHADVTLSVYITRAYETAPTPEPDSRRA